MRSLIDALLSLSGLSQEARPERFSLKQVLDESLQLLDRNIEETNATVKSTDLPEALIIPSQVGLLFQNLLTNSLKFTRVGVAPVISVSHRNLKSDEVHSEYGLPKAPAIEITIVDNGIGFDNAHNEKIFAVFQRLHNKDQYEGTGIGLSICRRIVKNHGGIINATGEPGKGATFRVVLPA
jgi:signal transduction histidine kinase